MNAQQKNTWGLIGVYVLLFLTAILVRQAPYYRLGWLLTATIFILALILMRYLYQKRIIKISFFSTVYEKKLPKNERRFLYAIMLYGMPILKLHDITLVDIILSICVVFIAVFLYRLDENYLAKKS